METLLASCKGLATAYHSSCNFATAVHKAQCEVYILFSIYCSFVSIGPFLHPCFGTLSLCFPWPPTGPVSAGGRESLGSQPGCEHQVEQPASVHALDSEVGGSHPARSDQWRVQEHEVPGEKLQAYLALLQTSPSGRCQAQPGLC